MDADRGAKLPNRLRNVPLVPHADEEMSWSYWKSRYAPPKSESEDEKAYQARKAQAQERERRFEAAAAAADVAQLMPIHGDVQETMTALADLNKLAMEKFKNMAPGTTAFRQALEEIEVLLRRIIRGKGGFAEATPSDGAAATPATNNNNSQADSSGPIKTRDDAFRKLAEVSAYLRKTEPQSPVPFLIDRAISWGKLPFTQLMEEIIKDANVRGQVGELLGIKAGGGDGKK
jgi:type VI secretion system protein ImpA